MNDLMNLAESIFTQRAWSWALIGILQLAVFLIVRNLFFRPVLGRIKLLNSKWRNEIKKIYSKQLLPGWIFFLVSLLVLIVACRSGNFLVFTPYEVTLLGLIALSLFLAILSHLVALAIALLQVLKQIENNQLSL